MVGMAQESLAQPAAPGMAGRGTSFGAAWRRHSALYLMLVPAAVLLIVFGLYPLWGVSIAFVRYNPVKGLAGSPWVGLAHFREVFRRGVMAGLLRNTLLISSGKILLGELAGLAFALLVREVGWRPYRRLVQTVATIPHFFSWVIMGALMLSILGSSGGVNDLLVSLGLAKVRFLADKRIFPYVLVLSDVWKEFGWSSVIYLAALTQIDPHLLEAAAVDGAGRGARLWSIELPIVVPTLVFMIVLGFGYVLDAGFEQVLVLYNPTVYQTGDILDTYVYRMGLVNFKFEIATVVGVVKCVVGFAAILIANWVSGKVADQRIF
jgi:putative aldouronate transport system permease protein